MIRRSPSTDRLMVADGTARSSRWLSWSRGACRGRAAGTFTLRNGSCEARGLMVSSQRSSVAKDAAVGRYEGGARGFAGGPGRVRAGVGVGARADAYAM